MAELLRSAGKREKRFGECLTVSRQGETIWLYLPGGRKVKMEHAWLADPTQKTFEAMMEIGLAITDVEEAVEYVTVVTNMNNAVPDGLFMKCMAKLPKDKQLRLAQKFIRIKQHPPRQHNNHQSNVNIDVEEAFKKWFGK
jgi:hypothetical protein